MGRISAAGCDTVAHFCMVTVGDNSRRPGDLAHKSNPYLLCVPRERALRDSRTLAVTGPQKASLSTPLGVPHRPPSPRLRSAHRPIASSTAERFVRVWGLGVGASSCSAASRRGARGRWGGGGGGSPSAARVPRGQTATGEGEVSN